MRETCHQKTGGRSNKYAFHTKTCQTRCFGAEKTSSSRAFRNRNTSRSKRSCSRAGRRCSPAVKTLGLQAARSSDAGETRHRRRTVETREQQQRDACPACAAATRDHGLPEIRLAASISSTAEECYSLVLWPPRCPDAPECGERRPVPRSADISPRPPPRSRPPTASRRPCRSSTPPRPPRNGRRRDARRPSRVAPAPP